MKNEIVYQMTLCFVRKCMKTCLLQGIFLMYLYVGSIAVIICIYIWVLIDSCASLNSPNEMPSTRRGMAPANVTTNVAGERDAEMAGGLSLTRFGSLKRAHISRAKTSGTSFYLRVGALGKFHSARGRRVNGWVARGGRVRRKVLVLIYRLRNLFNAAKTLQGELERWLINVSVGAGMGSA